VQSGPSRSIGDAEGNGDLVQRHPEEVVHRDDRPVTRIETPERRVHELAIGDLGLVVWGLARVDR
jgi:hypothetical protein